MRCSRQRESGSCGKIFFALLFETKTQHFGRDLYATTSATRPALMVIEFNRLGHNALRTVSPALGLDPKRGGKGRLLDDVWDEFSLGLELV
jgi:hypothetical protein